MSGLAPELEKLLVLQEREQRQMRLNKELAAWPNEMKLLEQRRVEVRAGAEKKRLEAQNAEVERKKLELEAEAHRAKAARYKVQQFETRKNEEFTALGTEIQREEKEVQEIEDRELELMALGEKANKEAVVEAEGAKVKEGELAVKEEELKKKKTELETRLADLMKEIETLALGVEESLLNKYRRIMASKKDVAVVSVEHGRTAAGVT